MASSGGEVLFDVNQKEDDLTHDEIWDDTILIQQYDEALSRVRKKINSRMGTTESEQSEVATMSERENNPKKKKKKAKKKNGWRVGDYCRSRYSEDGGVYEATIVSLQAEKGKVTVRYVGYNNEEEISMKGLMKSKGQEARRRQEELTEDGQSEISDFGSSVQESDMQSDTDGERSGKARQSQQIPRLPQHRMPPPSFYAANTQFNPPPYLPDLPPPPALAMDMSDDPRTSEALHTMLMSWYMTGYHTGYYQGLKTADPQKPRKKHK